MNRRKGTILIVTLWIIMVLAGLVLTLASTVRVEATISANGTTAAQAQAVELGAIQYVRSRLASLKGQLPAEANLAPTCIRVGDGGFWILRPNFNDEHTYAYGIVDESSKLDLNVATSAMMQKLPDMTAELADSIVDWRDTDSDVSTTGAEGGYYLMLPNPYNCKNAPLETVEEVLLIKGGTPDILYGEDTNRNGVLDLNEDDGLAGDPADNQDGNLDRGLSPYVTVYSQERNVDANGAARININDVSQNSTLLQALQKATSPQRAVSILSLVLRQRPYPSALDFAARAGLTDAEFKAVADRLTTSSQAVLKGLVNVNAAPREVLACLPGLTDADVVALINKRVESGVDPSSIAWVRAALPGPKAGALGAAITTRSYRFSADIVSVSGDGRAFKRCRIVVDTLVSPPKVIYRQDLTHLGWPLAPEILSALRAGASLDDVNASLSAGAAGGNRMGLTSRGGGAGVLVSNGSGKMLRMFTDSPVVRLSALFAASQVIEHRKKASDLGDLFQAKHFLLPSMDASGSEGILDARTGIVSRRLGDST